MRRTGCRGGVADILVDLLNLVGEAGAGALELRVGDILLAAGAGDLKDGRGDLAGGGVGAVGVAGRGAEIAEVAGEAGDGKLVGEGGLLSGPGGFDLLGGGGKVFACLQSLLEGLLRVDVVERLEGRGVGEAEVLVERKADGAGERELVFGELVAGGDEVLLLVLVVDLGAEDVEAGADAGIVRGDGLIERDLGGGEFGVDGLDARGVGDAEQVGVADGEDDHVAGVFGGELCGLKVVLGGEVVLERLDVDEVLREVGAEVDDLKGADDGVETGKFEAEGGEVDLLDLDRGGCR